VAIGASPVLLRLVAAFGGFVSRSMSGNGIMWPDKTGDDADEADVEQGCGDDEWNDY
jgi:hypothetical protein